MPDILHRVGIKAPAAKVYQALASVKGLAGWWTDDVTGSPEAGGTLHFQFGDKGFFDMKVISRKASRSVKWRVIAGPKEWIGTVLHFDLKREGGMTILLFKHQGWKKRAEFMHHCSTKWAIFLMSLKALAEKGRGQPFPRDVKIDNWN